MMLLDDPREIRPGDAVVIRTGAVRIVTAVRTVNGNQIECDVSLPPIRAADIFAGSVARFDFGTAVICLARNYPLGDQP